MSSILPTFGLNYIRVDDQAQPVLGANLDVVGLIGPCSTANSQRFPYNTPVLVFSNDTTLFNDLGTDGYLADALNGINAQLADFQVAAQVVIVVTPYGTASDINLKLQQTIANIMGNSIAGTGVWAFLKAPNMLYCTPRLLMAPGYTGQMANSLDVINIQTPGIGYTPNQTYQLTFQQGVGETNGANLVLPTAHAVADPFGSINELQIFIDAFGAWFTVAPTVTFPPPDGPPIVGQQAAGQIIFQRMPGVGASITFNGTQVTFVSGTPSGNQVQLDPAGALSATLTNLLNFLTAQTASNANIFANTYTLVQATLNITQKATGTAGNGYTLATNITGASISGSHLSGGIDAAASVTATASCVMALGANPVVASLSGGVLDGLMGHAIVESAGTSLIGDENWRDTINSPRIIALSGGVKIQDPVSGNIIVRPIAPRVIGTMIARDYATGYPFHSAANQPISGIVGPARTIAFSLTDGSTEGQQLLSANIGILVRGLIGVETAISSGGFIFIGTDTCSDDLLWTFYNVTRGRDYIELSLMPALRVYLGRNNIDQQTVMNILNTIRGFLGQLQAEQQILGYSVQFQGNLNSVSEIRLGHLTVGFAAEEPPVLRRITTMSARYAPAIDAMVAELEQQLNIAA